MKYCPKCKSRAEDSATTCAKCGGPVRRMGEAPPEPSPPAAAPTLSPVAQKSSAAAPPSSSREAAVPPASPPREGATSKKPQPPAAVPPAPVATTPRPVASPEAKYSLAGEPALTMELQGLQHAVAAGQRRVGILGATAALLCMLLVTVLIWRHFHEVFQYAETSDVEFIPVANEQAVEIRYQPKSAGRLQITRIGTDQTEQLTEFIEPRKDGFGRGEFAWQGSDTPKVRFVVKHRRGWSLREQTWSLATRGRSN